MAVQRYSMVLDYLHFVGYKLKKEKGYVWLSCKELGSEALLAIL